MGKFENYYHQICSTIQDVVWRLGNSNRTHDCSRWALPEAYLHFVNRCVRPTEFRFEFTEDFQNVMQLLFIIHYLNHIHYLVRKCLVAHQYLSNVQKASKTAWNHGLKIMRQYTHRYCCFGNFRVMLNECWPIITDAVDHISKASLLKRVYTLCKWCNLKVPMWKIYQ